MGKKFFCLFLFGILVFSCNTDDEPDNACDIPLALVDCAAPITFTGISVYFVDKETDENSFVSGALTLEDIKVTDSDDNKVKIELQEIELHESDLPFRSHSLVIHDNFESGENKYRFKIKGNIQFDITLNAIEYTPGCCLGIYLDDLQIEGADHNLEHSIYTPIIYIV